MPHVVPLGSSFYRVFRALDPNSFAACMRVWASTLTEALAGKAVTFDGKALRGALARGAGDTLHLVKVWACEQRLLLVQETVEGAPSEIAWVRDLLAALDLKGVLVTADAAHR